MSKLFSEPFHQALNKSEIATRNVGTECLKKTCYREPQPQLWVVFQSFCYFH